MTRWFKHVDCPAMKARRGDAAYWNGAPRCPHCKSEDIVETDRLGNVRYEPITYDPSDGSAKGVRGSPTVPADFVNRSPGPPRFK